MITIVHKDNLINKKNGIRFKEYCFKCKTVESISVANSSFEDLRRYRSNQESILGGTMSVMLLKDDNERLVRESNATQSISCFLFLS